MYKSDRDAKADSYGCIGLNLYLLKWKSVVTGAY